MHGLGKLLQEMAGAEIENALYGVNPQGVNVVLRHPVAGVVDEIAPHLIAVRPVKVDCLSPRRLVPVGEIGREAPQVVPLGTEMIVDHVEDNGQALP